MSINHFASNPRTISKKEHARLTKDLADLGDLGGICHDLDTNSLIGGNQRSEIMGVISGENAPVITERFEPATAQGTVALGYVEWRGEKYAYRAVQGWTDEQRRRANIEANRAGGSWSPDILANEWNAKELIGFGFDEDWLREQGKMYGAVLNMLEAEKPEPVDADPQIYRAEELQKIWQVKRGDLWQIGEHRLLCGDSTVRADVERVMGGEKARLFATDPPYGVAYNDETGDKNGDTIANDENDGPKLQAFLESAFSAWLPSLEKNCAWYLWHAQMTQGFFAAAAAAAAVLIHRQIIWVKPSLIMGHGDYHWKHELCFYGWVKGSRPPFYGQRNQTTTWEFPRHKETPHPTEKPQELWNAPMNNHTVLGEVCAEPFAGSGSQYVSGQNLGRRVYGIDFEPKWCAVILQRMTDAFPGIEIKRLN